MGTNELRTSLHVQGYHLQGGWVAYHHSDLLKTNYRKPAFIKLVLCGLPPKSLHCMWAYPTRLQKALFKLYRV